MVNKDLLQRYFNNACTAEEREQLASWLMEPRHREEVLTYLEEEWNQWRPSAEMLAQASAEANLPFSTLFAEAKAREQKSSPQTGRIFFFKNRVAGWTAVAAACVLVLTAGIGIGYYFKGKSHADTKEPMYFATAQTLRGQRSRVVLSDGSEVYLNAESRIRFSNGPSAKQVVYLEGEAFFKVPQKERQLIVKTKDMVANTKGSQFNISAFPKDSTVTISVANGQTEISPNEERTTFPLMALRKARRDSTAKQDTAAAKPKTMPMLLIRPVTVNANETVTFDRNKQITSTPARLNEEELRSWKEGFLYFNHADSAGLVDRLQRWFDVDVTLKTEGQPLKTLNCGFRNATLDDVLEHIGNELGLDYRIEGKHIYLTKRTR
ncbi:MAG: FecR domain-containing protein [Bacteroidetes bacterium]|nr:FecR domain-containing protein [Bacteroidota bacterium]